MKSTSMIKLILNVDITLTNGLRLNYTTEEIKVSDTMIRFTTDDNVGVGIPITSILYWETTEVGE